MILWILNWISDIFKLS